MNEQVRMRKTFTCTLSFFAFIAIAGLTFSSCKGEDAATEPSPTPIGSNEVEPNDNVPNDLGILGASVISVTGVTSVASDVDRFVVTVAAGTNLNASLGWQGQSDLNLGFMDSRGISISYQRTSSNPERCTLPNRDAGRYIIEVTSATAGSTSYTLTIAAR